MPPTSPTRSTSTSRRRARSPGAQWVGHPTMPKPPLPDELIRVLANPNPAIIGTVTPDGAPNTVATWYVWDDGRALVNMDEGRKRLEYLRREPRVSLTVLDGHEWYRHITL